MPLSWNEVNDYALVFSKEQATNYFFPQMLASPILEKNRQEDQEEC